MKHESKHPEHRDRNKASFRTSYADSFEVEKPRNDKLKQRTNTAKPRFQEVELGVEENGEKTADQASPDREVRPLERPLEPIRANWWGYFWLLVLILTVGLLVYPEYQRFKSTHATSKTAELSSSLQRTLQDVANFSPRVFTVLNERENAQFLDLDRELREKLTEFETRIGSDNGLSDAKKSQVLQQLQRAAYSVLPELALLLKSQRVVEDDRAEMEKIDDSIQQLKAELDSILASLVVTENNASLLALIGEQRLLLVRIRTNLRWLAFSESPWEQSVDVVKTDIKTLASNNAELTEQERLALSALSGSLIEKFSGLQNAMAQAVGYVEQRFALANAAYRVAHNSVTLGSVVADIDLGLVADSNGQEYQLLRWAQEEKNDRILMGLALFAFIALLWVSSRYRKKKLNRNRQSAKAFQSAINRLVFDIEGLTEGDLTVEARTNDEITQSLALSINLAVSQMRLMVEEIRLASMDVDERAGDMSSLISRFRLDNETQYAQVTGVYGDIRKISDVIDFFYKNSSQSYKWLDVSVEAASEGSGMVKKTVQSLSTSKTQIQDTLGKLRRLTDNSQQIGDLLKAVQDAAERTNVLSLNASIQAAMAGEAGKGFAIVVEEVQRLSERSADASSKIEEMLQSVQKEINNAAFLMETTNREISSGVRTTNESEAIFDRIQSANQQLIGAINQFSGESGEELETMESISDRIEMLNISSQRNNSNASEVANSMGQLKRVAQTLNRSIVRFKVD